MAHPWAAELGISGREAETLAALGEHLTNAEIAARLFISVRTVESHVSSLLRKLDAADRRALAAIAGKLVGSGAAPAGSESGAARPALPVPLTSFVGRRAERAELAAALRAERLVTACGPGGQGKTRLALATAGELAAEFADGVAFVDLVPVTDEAMIPAALAQALGLGGVAGRTVEESVLGWLADRRMLVVLDNCEHLLDGLGPLLERLLARAPRLVLLATSRSRLLLPFERVFTVPGLSLPSAGDGDAATLGEAAPGDAVELFLSRSEMAGVRVPSSDHHRVAAVCAELDAMPLAIELAAARLPAVGLDGLEVALTDRLRLLTGPRRADGRHRSLRSTLDWSYALLDPAARAVLRQVAVFAGPFSPAAAAHVAEPPSDTGAISGAMPVMLAELAEHSLLVTVPGDEGTRYAALETIRQYGTELLSGHGELSAVRTRHLRWSLTAAEDLLAAGLPDDQWNAAVDRLADELHGALAWAQNSAGDREAAYRTATAVAALCHRRGLPAEAQQRSELAAALAGDDVQAAASLRRAAGSATARFAGDDAVRLRRAAADAAIRAGEPVLAARELAEAAELVNRSSGLIAELPPQGVIDSLLVDARRLAGDDALARARIATAEAFSRPETHPATAAATEHALDLARRCGDPMIESAALDRLTTILLARGEAAEALATASRRIDILAGVAGDADRGSELHDACAMATWAAVGAGDLREARRMAEHLVGLPMHREVGYVAQSRLILVSALSGDWETTVAGGQVFLDSWRRAGRPAASTLRRSAVAAAAVHGMRGDDDGRRTWLAVAEDLAPVERRPRDRHVVEFFEAMTLLHAGRAEAAVECLTVEPDELRRWYEGMWRPWFAALWAEAAVLAGHADAPARLLVARGATTHNPVASAQLDRAVALQTGDRDGVLAAGAALKAAGNHYQWARSLVLAGGDDAEAGRAALADLGATTG